MAKEQKRGNREVRKPKMIKKPVAEPASSQLKGVMATLAGPKKKG